MTDTTASACHPTHHHLHSAYGAGYGGVYGNYGGSDFALHLSNQIASSTQSVSDKMYEAGANGIKETSDASRDVIGAIRHAAGESSRLGELNLQATERNGGAGIAATERAAAGIASNMNFNQNQLQRDFAGIASGICDTRREISDGLGDVKLEAAKQFAALQLEACKQHADLARQADANTAALAKQLAECCCDQKMEAARTRELIQNNAKDECLRRETALQGEVNMLRIQQWQASQHPGGGHK